VSEQSSNLATSLMVLASKIGRGLIMDKLEIKRALLYNKPSILNKTVGLVENIVFPDRIDFYPISPSPSNRHVWESLVTFDTQARRSFHL
jgi:hypothetical protein